jgi:hypothetical protein
LDHQPLSFRFRQARETEDIETPKYITEQLSFSKDHYKDWDFKTAFNSPSSWPLVPKGISKDDILLNQTSKSKIHDTSIHQQISTPDRKSRHKTQEPDGKADGDQHERGWLVDPELKRTILADVSEGAYVYVLQAPDYFIKNKETPCVKIGISADVKTRITQLQKACGLKGLERVKDPMDRPHQLAKRIEQLCHTELSSFNRVLKCTNCKTGKETEHKEWFAVPADVALKTVQRWRKFIQQDPYDKNGRIRTHWSEMLYPENTIKQPALERDDDHEERNERWTKWLENGIAKKNHSPPQL